MSQHGGDGEEGSPTLLFIGHDAFRAGAQIALLHLVRWFRTVCRWNVLVVLKRGGELLVEYEAIAPTYVIERQGGGTTGPSSWLSWLGQGRASIWERLSKRRIDAVYVNTVAALDVVADVTKRWRCPILCHVHELEMSIRRFYGIDALQRSAPAITAFVAASRAVSAYLVHGVGLPSDRVHVIYEGIVIPEGSHQAPISPGRNSLPGNAFIVGGCGTVEWRKGTDLFVQTAGIVRQGGSSNRPIHFVWVGGPTHGREFEQLLHDCKLLGIDGMMHFVGPQARAITYLSSFNVFFLSSREDPFPLACLEAAATGVPILCFAGAGGMPEFVESGAGMIVPYLDLRAAAERILELAGSPELQARMGRQAADKVRNNHSIDQIGKEIMAVLQQYMRTSQGVVRV